MQDTKRPKRKKRWGPRCRVTGGGGGGGCWAPGYQTPAASHQFYWVATYVSFISYFRKEMLLRAYTDPTHENLYVTCWRYYNNTGGIHEDWKNRRVDRIKKKGSEYSRSGNLDVDTTGSAPVWPNSHFFRLLHVSVWSSFLLRDDSRVRFAWTVAVTSLLVNE